MKMKLKISKRSYKILLTSLCAFLLMEIGATVAYLIAESMNVNNSFIPGTVTTEIVEEFDNEVKNDVRIKNTGNINSFIRAKVVVTWQNEAGEVLGQMPVEGTDYVITWSGLEENGGWVKGSDGFYYHKASVLPITETPLDNTDAVTSILFTECKLKDNVTAPADGYHLNVEILGSGIQTLPTTAVDEWDNELVDVSVNNGTLSITNKGGN